MKSGLERRARNLYIDPSSGQWHVRVMINGNSVVRVFDTRRQADAAILALKHRKTAEQLGLVVPGDTPNIGKCLDQYIDDAEVRGLAPKTLRNYDLYRRHIRQVIGGRRPAILSNVIVNDYVRQRRRAGAGNLHIQIELRFLHTVIRDVLGQAFLVWSVPKLYDRQQHAPRPVPPDAEVAAVFHALEGTPYQRAFLICLLTALRQADACALVSTDMTDGVILTGMQKRRGQPIAVPVVATLAAALAGIDGAFTPKAQTVRAGLAYRTRNLPRPWSGLGRLRATAATWASHAGATDDNVGVMLGHTVGSVARAHYIRSTLPLNDPFIEVRRQLLEHVEARFLAAIQTKK